MNKAGEPSAQPPPEKSSPQLATSSRAAAGLKAVGVTARLLGGNDSTIGSGSHLDAGQQLRRTAIAGDVVDIDFRTAADAAVLGITGGEDLPPVIDAERFPGVEHPRRRQ